MDASGRDDCCRVDVSFGGVRDLVPCDRDANSSSAGCITLVFFVFQGNGDGESAGVSGEV